MIKKERKEMSKTFMRKAIALSVTVFMMGSIFMGCSKTDPSSASSDNKAASTQGTQAKESNTEKTKVVFWYLWSGDEIGQIANEFNNAQDKYTVECLSVPDMQKITVAIASGNGPDVTDDFNDNIPSYAEKGVVEPLDDYIKKSNYDMSGWMPGVIEGCTYNGKIYAMHLNSTFFGLFYNKKLLAEAGITEPAKTDKELLEQSKLLTKFNDDKTIKVIGFPEFPSVYYDKLYYGFGASFLSDDGKKFTPNNSAVLDALKMRVDFRNFAGLDAVTKFNDGSKYCDANDPFMTNSQAYRIDGPWLGSNIQKLGIGSDVLDYGIAPLPYPDGKPELAGGGSVTSSVFYINAHSKNKDGAWAFLSWLSLSEQITKLDLNLGNFPSRTKSLEDAAIKAVPDFVRFGELGESKNLKAAPLNGKWVEIYKLFTDEIELAINLKQSPEDALANAEKKGNEVLGQ